MTLPPGYRVRPATLEDLPQVVALFDASDAAYGLAPGMDLEFFRTLFLGRGFDPERNSFLITGPDGELVGYGDVKEELEEDAVTHFGKVHPEHRSRGLGGWLVRALEHRAIEIAAGRPLMLRATALWLDDGGIRLYEMLGYRHVRDFMHMERSLEGLAPLALPSGVTIRHFREGDGPSFHRIETEAFRGQWGISAVPFEAWTERLQEEAFRPEMWLLARCDGRDAGVLIGRGGTKEAWVASLAVLEEFRGRGIGGALLRHSFHVFQEHGYGGVALNVDSDNPTGATKLYEAQGMHMRRRWLVYDKEPPGTIPPDG
ncbi:MAG TPA: GNAT family N-acetyltransferase [Actinomycetota bacterium]|nr:GNAT family N-acetyltransferase [Actinomycetota bacterium]